MAKLQDVIRGVMTQQGFCSIDLLAKVAMDRGVFDDEFMGKAAEVAVKAVLRRELKRKDDKGDSLYHSVSVPDDAGEFTPVYKQETLFDVEDFRRVVNYYVHQANYNANEARKMARHCFERYAVQLPLDLEVALYAPD